MDTISSTDAARTVNNVVRHEYRVLNDAEKAGIGWLKDTGAALVVFCEGIKDNGISPREMSLAITKIEEAVMWAVKGITA